jgi:hypothetical protein
MSFPVKTLFPLRRLSQMQAAARRRTRSHRAAFAPVAQVPPEIVQRIELLLRF